MIPLQEIPASVEVRDKPKVSPQRVALSQLAGHTSGRGGSVVRVLRAIGTPRLECASFTSCI